jgi:hypothetical protein
VFTGEQDRIAGLATVSGDRHGSSAAVCGDQACDRIGSHQRLVRQRHHDGAHVRVYVYVKRGR